MRRCLALLLSCALVLTGCGQSTSSQTPDTEPVINEPVEQTSDVVAETQTTEYTGEEITDGYVDEEIAFGSLNDPTLIQYVEDDIYASLAEQLSSEDYVIENVSAVYVSQEYIDELTYNSKSNVFFGYTLEEIDAQFQGTRYVFTLGENGETTVIPFEEYDDTYQQVIKNVAIGTGVILVCVTVSVVTAGTGAPACVSMVFAAAAKTGTAFALSSGTLSAVAAGTITGIETKDFDAALKAAALQGSEGFKWGAITGVITGGATESLALYKSATTIPTPRQSEMTVLSRTDDAVEQVSFLNGKEVAQNTVNATRPDVVVRNANGTVQAIEVKNYNLANASNRGQLYRELERQVTSRVANLPSGSTQKIVLDVRGRNFSQELIDMVKNNIHLRCNSAYPDIPIEVLTY